MLRHFTLLLKISQPGLHPGQSRQLRLCLALNLGPLQLEQSAQFLHHRSGFQETGNFLQSEAEVLERQNPVEPGQLISRVVAVIGKTVHPCRLEQTQLVIIP